MCWCIKLKAALYVNCCVRVGALTYSVDRMKLAEMPRFWASGFTNIKYDHFWELGRARLSGQNECDSQTLCFKKNDSFAGWLLDTTSNSLGSFSGGGSCTVGVSGTALDCNMSGCRGGGVLKYKANRFLSRLKRIRETRKTWKLVKEVLHNCGDQSK